MEIHWLSAHNMLFYYFTIIIMYSSFLTLNQKGEVSRLKMWSVWVKAAWELWVSVLGGRRTDRHMTCSAFAHPNHLLPRTDPDCEQWGSYTQQDKKTHGSHISEEMYLSWQDFAGGTWKYPILTQWQSQESRTLELAPTVIRMVLFPPLKWENSK